MSTSSLHSPPSSQVNNSQSRPHILYFSILSPVHLRTTLHALNIQGLSPHLHASRAPPHFLPSTSHCHSTEGGVSGAEGELRADQLFDSVLPPSKGRATRVDQYREGLWAFTQPLPIPLVGDPDLRMTVARLLDGSLWVGPSGLNPVPYTLCNTTRGTRVCLQCTTSRYCLILTFNVLFLLRVTALIGCLAIVC